MNENFRGERKTQEAWRLWITLKETETYKIFQMISEYKQSSLKWHFRKPSFVNLHN